MDVLLPHRIQPLLQHMPQCWCVWDCSGNCINTAAVSLCLPCTSACAHALSDIVTLNLCTNIIAVVCGMLAWWRHGVRTINDMKLYVVTACCRHRHACSGGGISTAASANVTMTSHIVQNNTAQYQGGGISAGNASDVSCC